MGADSAIVAPAPALAGRTKALTAVALALGTFMQVLDTSIANVSIPTISGDLGVSSDQGTWVITSFAVANGVSVPLTGWLMQRFGVVRTFVASVALFTVASLLCGLAWSLPSLIVFRVLQGAVSGPMIPGSQALLINVFGPLKRHTALMSRGLERGNIHVSIEPQQRELRPHGVIERVATRAPQMRRAAPRDRRRRITIHRVGRVFGTIIGNDR